MATIRSTVLVFVVVVIFSRFDAQDFRAANSKLLTVIYRASILTSSLSGDVTCYCGVHRCSTDAQQTQTPLGVARRSANRRRRRQRHRTVASTPLADELRALRHVCSSLGGGVGSHLSVCRNALQVRLGRLVDFRAALENTTTTNLSGRAQWKEAVRFRTLSLFYVICCFR